MNNTCAVSYDVNNHLNEEHEHELIDRRFPEPEVYADDLSNGEKVEIGNTTYTAVDVINWVYEKDKHDEEFNKNLAKAVASFANVIKKSFTTSFLDRDVCAYFYDLFYEFAKEKREEAIENYEPEQEY